MELANIKQLAQSFTGDKATGIDAREESDYMNLVTEFEHGQGLDTAPVNWANVRKLAISVLDNHAKDLNAANYLCAALYFEQGFEGLTAGFNLLRAFVQADYWEDIYPPPKAMSVNKANKYRAATFPKMLKKLERPFADLEVTLVQSEAVIACKEAFTALDKALIERLEDKAPKLFEFSNVFGRMARDAQFLQDEMEELHKEEPTPVKKIPPVAQPPVPSTPAVVQQTPVATPAPVPAMAKPVAVAAPADIEKALTANLLNVAKMAKMLRDNKISNPYPYHLLRTSAWMLIEKLPANGVLPALPNRDRIASLRLLEQSKNWEALIEECEKSFGGGAIYWLGVHRFVAIALSNLGAKEACESIKNSVAALLARFPEYLDRTFNDAEGFADEITKAWIETEVLSGSVSTSDGQAPVPVPAGDALWSIAAADAKKMAATGSFEEGLALFSDGLKGVAGEREQMYWRLEQARYCLESGQQVIAKAQLVYLYQEVQERGIDKWEPQLNLSLARLLLICFEKDQGKQSYTNEQLNQIETLRTVICLHDPLGAMSLK